MKISVVTPSIRPKGLAITQQSLSEQTFTDFEWLVELGIPGKGHDLNAAYNRMIRRTQGELIVSLQDFIKAPPDLLQRLWETHEANPRAFITVPVGKVDNLSFEGTPKWDWRGVGGKALWQGWEIDCGAAPRTALVEIGGFDEELDQHWSCDNVNVGKRASLARYDFVNLADVRCVAYDHDAFIEHPFRKNYHPSFNNERMEQFERGLKLHYL